MLKDNQFLPQPYPKFPENTLGDWIPIVMDMIFLGLAQLTNV